MRAHSDKSRGRGRAGLHESYCRRAAILVPKTSFAQGGARRPHAPVPPRLGLHARIRGAGHARRERSGRGNVAASLDYLAASGCPAVDDFEAVVESHLGYSPFRVDALRHVIVRIERSDRLIEGRVEWRNDTGGWAGERAFPSRSGDCGELARAMGFALALQFQLLAADAPPAAPPPPPTVSASPPSALGPPEAPAAAARLRPSIAVGAGASAGVGLSPEITALGRLFGSLTWSHVAVELAAEMSLPSTLHRADGTGFSQQTFLAGIAGCGVRSRWSACLLANVGEIRVAGEGVDLPATATRPFVQTGIRLAVTQMLGRQAHVGVHADGLALITRGIVTLDSMAVWTTPRVAAALGLDVGVRFQ